MLDCDNCGRPTATLPLVVMVDFGGYEIGLPCMLCRDCFRRREEIKHYLAQKRKAKAEAGPPAEPL